MEKEKKYELIEQFLGGSLSEQARSDFEKKIQADPKLKAEINLHREIAEVTRGEKFNELRNVLKETNAEWKESEKQNSEGRVVGFSFMKRAIAAAVVILFGLLIWNFINTKPVSGGDIFASNFEPYQMVLTQRSLDENTKELNTAISNYANKNFAEAEQQFAALAELTPNQPILKMYECNAALAAGRNDAAIECFEKLLTVSNLKEQARWYLGLTYLQKGDLANAAKTFLQIEEGNYKHKEAVKILKKIK